MTEDLLENIEITPREVKTLSASGEKFAFVDVREQWEHDTSHIDGSILIPLREIPAHLRPLKEAAKIVIFCHHGMRSLDAAVWLRSQGVADVRSMSGGIDRWAAEIDPSVARY
jgi:rhodanese-related sulfurtransferase